MPRAWACRTMAGAAGPARPGANAARMRLSAVGSSCRITLPIYCIWRVRAPCERIRCAATTASCRVSGRSSRASWAADRATSWTPSACNACASRLRWLLLGVSGASAVGSAGGGGRVVLRRWLEAWPAPHELHTSGSSPRWRSQARNTTSPPGDRATLGSDKARSARARFLIRPRLESCMRFSSHTAQHFQINLSLCSVT